MEHWRSRYQQSHTSFGKSDGVPLALTTRHAVSAAGSYLLMGLPSLSPLFRIAIILFFLLPLPSPLFAQDIHFSQLDVNPILNNPAYAGFFDGIGRAGISYRSQWASVSKHFQTIAASAELSLLRRRYNRDGLSASVFFYNDRAGTLHYGTTAGNFILSYYKVLGSQNSTFLSVAAEVGIGQSGFTTDDILFSDPSEDITTTNTDFYTLGVGLAWFHQPSDDFYIKVGASGRNLNRPNISYLQLDSTYLERKLSIYSRAEYRAWANVSIMPVVGIMAQKKYREILFGADAKWYLAESSSRLLTFSGGIHYRWRDAATIELAMEYNAWIFALSYDANLSRLTPASKTVGAMELGIVYRIQKQKQVRRKAMPCPIM